MTLAWHPRDSLWALEGSLPTRSGVVHPPVQLMLLLAHAMLLPFFLFFRLPLLQARWLQVLLPLPSLQLLLFREHRVRLAGRLSTGEEGYSNPLRDDGV